MKALTVQQPWAWAIIHGGKDVENRTQLWKHRGPLAIHAGARLSQRGCELVPDLLDATRPDLLPGYADTTLTLGAVIGVVTVVDVHVALPDCCDSVWAEQTYAEHGGRVRSQLTHLVLEDPQPVDPIPCKGRLGLWDLPWDVAHQLPERWLETEWLG